MTRYDSGPTTVLLVGDDTDFMESLVRSFAHHDDLECIGLAETVAEGLAMAAGGEPDVVLISADRPDAAIEGTTGLKRLCPRVPVIILTSDSDMDVVACAAAAGASGFFPKQGAVDEIVGATRTVAQGGILMGSDMLAALIGRARDPGEETRHRAKPPPGLGRLAPRERQVLDLLGEGLDTKTIARRLGISVHTCRGYSRSLFAKLGVHSQLQAVATAARHGLLGGPSSSRPSG